MLKKAARIALTALIWLCLWEIAALITGSELLLPGPAATAKSLFSLLVSGQFWASAAATLARISAGYILGMLAGAVLAQPWDGKITCALAGAGVFILLALAAPLLDRPWPRAVGAQLAKISYAVFLVHHVLIQELAAHFDLAVLSRRDTAFLFVVYLAATFAAAHALLWLQRTLRTGLAALRSPI